MPGNNHKPWCSCGWCCKERGQKNILGISNSYNSIPTPKILTTTQLGKSRTYPTECPWRCGETVYYHTNGNGDTVYLDWLGSPWEIHGCFERYWQQEQERRKLLGSLSEYQHIMTRGVDERKNRERLLHGAIDSIEGAVTEETIASSMGLRGKSELRKYYGELYQPIEFSKDDWDKEVYRAINKGEDLQFDLTLGFRDAIFGCEKTIRIQHLEVSSNSNVVPTIKTLRVNVPVGVDSGTRLRVVGEGDVSRSNGDPGDLYICLTVLLTEEGFRREGTNIFSELIITTEEASQGAKVDVLTIHGEEKLRLPKQTSNGKCFVLKGRGVRKLASPTERGDHIVQVKFK